MSDDDSILDAQPWRRVEAPADVLAVPTMLAPQEQALLYWLARDYATGAGAIVDAGCFLGGSSVALLAGLRDRPQRWSGPPVSSYDQFLVEEYTLERYFGDDPGLAVGDSFRPRYDDNVGRFDAPHVVHEGDITQIGWSGDPIEILFIDVLKTWEVNDSVLHDFLPHVIPGRTVIVHQDYAWGQLPWVQLTVELMRDSLRWLDAVPWSSHVYLVERPISTEVLTANIREDVPDDDKLALLDRAIARDEGGAGDMVALAKAAMLWLLGRADEAHALVDAVEGRNDDPSVQLCAQLTRQQWPPR